MRRRAAPAIAWGTWLGALTAIQLAFGFWGWESYTLLGVAAFGTLLFGVWLHRARGPDTQVDYRSLPDTSWATVGAAVGAAVAVVGAIWGPWLVLPAAGVCVLGLAGVAREVLAERRGA